MRNSLTSVIATGLAVAVVAGAAGCGGARGTGGLPVAHSPAKHTPGARAAVADERKGVSAAKVYIQVLRRYLGTPAENSFPRHTFKTVYVLDRAYHDAADPKGKHVRGMPITAPTRTQVTAALAGMAHVVFVASRSSVIEPGGCGVVKNGGILITLGLPAGDARRLEVPINGYVACLGATWLTYILQDQPGSGWHVTGTTGTMGIS
jgi:hypothetical protein